MAHIGATSELAIDARTAGDEWLKQSVGGQDENAPTSRNVAGNDERHVGWHWGQQVGAHEATDPAGGPQYIDDSR